MYFSFSEISSEHFLFRGISIYIIMPLIVATTFCLQQPRAAHALCLDQFSFFFSISCHYLLHNCVPHEITCLPAYTRPINDNPADATEVLSLEQVNKIRYIDNQTFNCPGNKRVTYCIGHPCIMSVIDFHILMFHGS